MHSFIHNRGEISITWIINKDCVKYGVLDLSFHVRGRLCLEPLYLQCETFQREFKFSRTSMLIPDTEGEIQKKSVRGPFMTTLPPSLLLTGPHILLLYLITRFTTWPERVKPVNPENRKSNKIKK